MKILMVSWEYPPVVVGGLGRHVHQLSRALARAGHEVVVLARREPDTDALSHPTTDLDVEGVRVIAVAHDPPEFNFGTDMMAWTMAMGHSMIRGGLRLRSRFGSPWVPDVVHAHDWLVAHPAIALAEYFDVSLVATIHATEAGRHSGWVSGSINRQVHSVEWWLAAEADALITCSESMHDEVAQLFGPDLADTHIIHNGIDLAGWPFAERTVKSTAPQLLYAGRLEYEKGIQDLIAALPRIRRTHPGTTLTIAGEGTQGLWLRDLARQHRVLRAVKFIGTCNHAELVTALHRCDAIVLPSRYEPFGIVALEAAATGAPLVTSTAGGLGDAVTDSITGKSFAPGDVAGLAAAVRDTLDDVGAAQRRAYAARERLTDQFSWTHIAAGTAEIYSETKRRIREPIGRPTIVERPLPDRDIGNPAVD